MKLKVGKNGHEKLTKGKVLGMLNQSQMLDWYMKYICCGSCHVELFCQLTREKRVEEYEWLLAINYGHLILFLMFYLLVMNCENAELFKVH